MRCDNDLGRLLRKARLRQGISQRSLAIRARTSQDAVSRIERGKESPSFERFCELLLVMGHEAVLTTKPLGLNRGEGETTHSADLTPAERLRESASWNLFATRLELAGAEARRAGHPATRLSDD